MIARGDELGLKAPSGVRVNRGGFVLAGSDFLKAGDGQRIAADAGIND